MLILVNYIIIDGLIGNDCVVEIKCPFGAKDSSSFIEAFLNKKVSTYEFIIYYFIETILL